MNRVLQAFLIVGVIWLIMNFFIGAGLLWWSGTQGQEGLKTAASGCFSDCFTHLTSGEDVIGIEQVCSDIVHQREALFRCLETSCEPAAYGPALSAALGTCLDLGIEIGPLWPLESTRPDLSPRDLMPTLPEVVKYGPTAEEDLRVLDLDRDFIVAVGCYPESDSAQTLSLQPQGYSEGCPCACDLTSTRSSAMGVDATPEITASEITLWPPPCGASTASTTSSYETTITTTEQGTDTKTSVTFIRADPPSGWTPLPTTFTSGTSIVVTEITLWPPPAPAATVAAEVPGNQAADVDHDLVTLIAPNGVGGTREVVIAVPKMDLPWESVIPDILRQDASFLAANERRDLDVGRGDKLPTVAAGTHWRSHRPINTTLTLKIDSVIVAASAHHIASSCVLAAVCVVLMVLELFF